MFGGQEWLQGRTWRLSSEPFRGKSDGDQSHQTSALDLGTGCYSGNDRPCGMQEWGERGDSGGCLGDAVACLAS